MSYTKTNWKDLPDISTPVNATRLNNMETGIADANGAIGVNTYSASSTYSVGDYCIYNNKLYKCTTAISTAEAFNSTKWTQIKIAEEINLTGVSVLPGEPTGNNKNKILFKKSKNLFDKNSAQFGYFQASSGELTTGDANWKYVWIKVKPSTAYVVSGVTSTQGSIGIAEFDANGVNVPSSGFNYHNGTFTTKSTTAYLGACCRIGEVNVFQIEQGTTASSYENYVEQKIFIKNSNNVYEEFGQDEVIVSPNEPAGTRAKVWLKKGDNLFDGIVEVGTLDGSTGQPVPSNARLRSNTFIPVHFLTQYTIKVFTYNTTKGSPKIDIVYYNSNYGFISTSNWQDNNYTFSTPANCAYIKVLFYLSNSTEQTLIVSDITQVQLQQGSSASTYEAYIEPEIYTKNNNNIYEEFVSKKSMVLWTNVAPSSAFAAQTITLSDSFSNYSYYEIIYRQATGSGRLFSTGRIKVGYSTTLNLFNQYFYRRYANVGNDNTIQFLDGFYHATYGSSATTNDNTALIPFEVIGYK